MQLARLDACSVREGLYRGADVRHRRYDDVVRKLGGGTEAARSMGSLLSDVGSLLASEAAIAEVRPRALKEHLLLQSADATSSVCML